MLPNQPFNPNTYQPPQATRGLVQAQMARPAAPRPAASPAAAPTGVRPTAPAPKPAAPVQARPAAPAAPATPAVRPTMAQLDATRVQRGQLGSR